ncbi:MAG: hypothetical protein KDB21_07545 [Acidimicrobiales bacterium]|nr:hypothetical protein [Acidimicrobiales bacterium]
MDENVMRVFAAELELQCRMIQMGAAGLNHALQAGDGLGVWFYLQSILVSAANVSKIVTGKGRDRLRERLRLDVATLAITTRSVRNDFEHFDERIEKWYGPEGGQIYVGRYVGPPDALRITAPHRPDRLFHRFDPSSNLVSFWDNEVDVQQLVTEAEMIHERVTEMLAE